MTERLFASKLNLGAGFRKLDGFLNVDAFEGCEPDLCWNLEETPWPIEDACAELVLMSHVLEHLGATASVYLAIWRELYRVCKADARLEIIVPHPRHDDFLCDPTHVRPILPEQLLMFSAEKNRQWIAKGVANTPLALQCGIDFELEHVGMDLDDLWADRRRRGAIDDSGLQEAIRSQANVVRQVRLRLRAVKPMR